MGTLLHSCVVRSKHLRSLYLPFASPNPPSNQMQCAYSTMVKYVRAEGCSEGEGANGFEGADEKGLEAETARSSPISSHTPAEGKEEEEEEDEGATAVGEGSENEASEDEEEEEGEGECECEGEGEEDAAGAAVGGAR